MVGGQWQVSAKGRWMADSGQAANQRTRGKVGEELEDKTFIDNSTFCQTDVLPRCLDSHKMSTNHEYNVKCLPSFKTQETVQQTSLVHKLSPAQKCLNYYTAWWCRATCPSWRLLGCGFDEADWCISQVAPNPPPPHRLWKPECPNSSHWSLKGIDLPLWSDRDHSSTHEPKNPLRGSRK